MFRIGMYIGVVGLLCGSGMAQLANNPTQPATGNTVIGCLAGPDADDHYTLTSMQHRLGIEVVGGNEEIQSEALKKGAGSKVKLTGTWGTVPGTEGKKGDAARRFKATDVVVMNEKCEAPTTVTPLSKKKQAQQAQQQSPEKK